MEHRNTMPGYEVEAAEQIPDEEDVGVGLSAGSRVRIAESDPMFPGEEGVVLAVMRGQGAFFAGQIVVDVQVDGTDDPDESHRVVASDVETI